MFYQFDLELPIYSHLENTIQFEPVTKGRVGANLIDSSRNTYPLVRTTTIYSNPVQKFTPEHNEIITQIKAKAFELFNIDLGELNNGLAEIYTHEYKTMGFHSDQVLDLKPNSWICICSIYSNPELTNLRKLIVQSKETGIQEEYVLRHNSVIMFNLDTNNTYIHKIVLSNPNAKPNYNKWLGITLRTSKTHIKFINSKPIILDTMEELVLASEQEKKQFYSLRSQENKLINFNYPYVNYTISPSDLIYPSIHQI